MNPPALQGPSRQMENRVGCQLLVAARHGRPHCVCTSAFIYKFVVVVVLVVVVVVALIERCS